MLHGQLLKSWYMGLFQLPVLPERLLPTRRGVALLGGPGQAPWQIRRYLDALGPDGLTAALNWYRAMPFSLREHGYARPAAVPTTYVWSDRDAALGRQAAERTRKFVTGPYRFEVLLGVGHWIPDEAPAVLAELILDRARGDRSSG
jgi:pimeloyl-ACP methyl ester carboxylesterase